MGNILIHEGNIRKIFVSDVVLNKDHVEPTISDVVVQDDALFYSRMNKLISLEFGTHLLPKDEAMDYVLNVFDGGLDRLKELLSSPELTEEEKKRLLFIVSNTASCLYVNPKEVKPSFVVSSKEFKILKKTEKERRNQD